MTFTLPDLPFDKSALEPHISAQTFDFHHGKHHKAYVDKANDLIKGTALEGLTLEAAVMASHKDGGPLFNNIAQIYNHNIFWLSLTPKSGDAVPAPLMEKIESDFGGLDKFKEDFIAAGMSQFGSGWVWLVSNEGKLEIVKTANAETPLTDGKTPLLVCDVWEHAYYLDHQNKRADFLKAFVDNLINWEFAFENCKKFAKENGSCGDACKCA